MGQESQSAVVGQFEMVASMSGRLCRMLHLSEFRAYLQEPNPLAGLKMSTGLALRAAPDRRRFQVIDALKQLFLCCSPFSRSGAPCA